MGGSDTKKTFSEHWGWFGTLYQLSKTSILEITGDKRITDINFIFALNFLEIDKDYNNEIEKEQKKQIQQARSRY